MKRSVFLLLACAALAFGCTSKEHAAGTPPVADTGTPIDTEVMAFLSEARALHHQANIKEDAADRRGATQAIERLVHAQRPHPTEKIPEVEEVLADAFARLAELRLRGNDFDGALSAIDEGLSHAPAPTYFRGHLIEVHGIIEEAHSQDLLDAGKRDESAKARAHAIELLQEAVRVQEQVIVRALDDDGGNK